MSETNLDPSTNLPRKESDIAPIKFNPLKEAPSDKRVSGPTPFNLNEPYEFSTYKFNPDKDRYLQRGMNQEAYRASNQSFIDQSFNSIIGGAVSAAGTAIEDIGYMLDVPNNIALLTGAETAESNWLSNFGKGVKEWTDRKMPIYRQDPNQFFNFSDPGSYWTALKGLIDNAAGFAIPSAAGLKAISFAQKVSRYSRLLRVSKPIAEMIKVTGAGYWANVGESKMMALEAFENTKEDLITNHGMSEADATREAGKAARDMYLWNKAFLAGDIFGVAGLSRMKGFTRNAVKETDLLTSAAKYKKAFGTFGPDDLLAQGLSEYAEETGQEIMSKEAQYQATKPYKIEQDGTDLFLRAVGTFAKGETQYQGIMGFLAGAGQRVITQKLAGDKTSAIKAEYDGQQALVKETQEYIANEINNQKNLKDIMHDAALQGDEHMQELVHRANLTGISVKNFQRGTTESLLRLLQDRVDKGEEGAQADLDAVKRMEKQWVSDTRYSDPTIQPKVFHARESLSMAKDRIAYLQEQAKVAEEEVQVNPADRIAVAKKAQLDADVKEMGVVVEEMKKALATVTSTKYGQEVRKAREDYIAEVERKRKATIAQAKQKEKKDNFFTSAVKHIREGFKSKKDEELKETEAEVVVQPESAPSTQSVEEVKQPESGQQGTDQAVPRIRKPRKKKLEDKVVNDVQQEAAIVTPEEMAKVPPAAVASATIDGLLSKEQEVGSKSHFAHVDKDGHINLQEAIPGNELPYIAEQRGDMIELTPANNTKDGAVKNLEFSTLENAFELNGVKPGDKFMATSPAIYQKDGANWNLIKKGTVEKIVPVEKIEFTEEQEAIRNIALSINNIVGEELEGAEELTATLTQEQKLQLMRMSTDLFAKTAEMLLKDNPNYDFNSVETYYTVMKEISKTVSKKVMSNIYPYIKSFYAPTFQLEQDIAQVVAKIEFDTIFLSDEEIRQLIGAANSLENAALPEEMLTEEKLLLSDEYMDKLKEEGIQDGDITLTQHPNRTASYKMRETASNTLAFLHKPYVQVEVGGEVVRFDEDGFIDDYAAILDSRIVYEGAEFDVEVVDDNNMPMYLPGGAEGEMTTWGEIKANKEKYLEYYNFKTGQELIEAFIPIAVKHEGKVIAFIHNIEFINPLRVYGDADVRQKDAKTLLTMRKQMLHGVANKIKITQKYGGQVNIMDEPMTLEETIPQEHNDKISLGIIKEGQIQGHNVKHIKKVVNEDNLFPGLPYLFAQGNNGYVALAAKPGKLDKETATALVNAIFIAMHNGEISEEIQTMVDKIRSIMGIDIRGERGLQEYLSLFLYNFQPNDIYDNFQGIKNPLYAFILRNKGQLNSSTRFINFSGNSVDFGIGNASVTYSISKYTPTAVKDSLKNLLLQQLMDTNLQVSIPALTENKKTPVVLITAEGLKTINEDGNYLDFIKKGLLSRVNPIIIGDVLSFTYQPVVEFEAVLEKAPVADMSSMLVTSEPTATPVKTEKAFSNIQYVKDTKANRTKVNNAISKLNGYTDQQITEIVNSDNSSLIEREAARQIFIARSLEGQLKVEPIEEVIKEEIKPSSQIAQELGIVGPRKRASRKNIVEDELIISRQEDNKVDNKCKL